MTACTRTTKSECGQCDAADSNDVLTLSLCINDIYVSIHLETACPMVSMLLFILLESSDLLINLNLHDEFPSIMSCVDFISGSLDL